MIFKGPFTQNLGEKEIMFQEQDGTGGGRRGVHLSPRIHQEYTFDTEVHAEHQLRGDRST